MQSVLFARQPIFGRDRRVRGYELLFRRHTTDTEAIFQSGDHATARVIVGAFADGRLDALLGDHHAFINVTGALIRSAYARLLPRDRVVIEILEDTRVDNELVEELRKLREAGYSIALDDYEDSALERLLPLATHVKLDVQAMTPRRLERQIASLGDLRHLTLVAEKVETHEELERCLALGFDLFQGYFLARPDNVNGARAPASRLAVMRLLSRVFDPEVGLSELENLVRRDAGLSFRFLRIVNSAFFGLRTEVRSIRHALALLGLQATRRWASLIALSTIDGKPEELFVLAAIRAKMCELLGATSGQRDTGSFYVVGLLSMLDALMDAPLATLVGDLPLERAMLDALLHQRGSLGQALSCVRAHEEGRWAEVAYDDLDSDEIQGAYLEAVEWASQTHGHVAA